MKTQDTHTDHYASSPLIIVQDCALSVLASLLSVLVVRWLSEPIPGFTLIVLRWIALSLAAILAGVFITRNYLIVRRFSTLLSLGRTLLAVLIKEVLLIIVLIFHLVRLSSVSLSASLILVDLLLTSSFLLYIRVSANLFTRKSTEEIRDIVGRKNALVAGTSLASLQLADKLNEGGEYNVVGLISADPAMSGRVVGDLVVYPYEGPQSIELLQWKVGGVDSIFFPRDQKPLDAPPASGSTPATDGGSGGTTAADSGSGSSQATDSGPATTGGPGSTAAFVREAVPQDDGMTLIGHGIKRLIDIGGSGLLILLFSPLFLLCAIAVKLEDGGPVIYSQERIGRGGQPFRMFKLRSMRTDAEALSGPALYSGEEDPRLTRVGRFLRSHHLDELPQLFNVFRGDMSFIGYRPERQYYIDRIMGCDPRYRFLYQIRPGVTSYATLYNGYTDTLDKMLTRLELDLYYLRNHSLLFDAKVLGLTFLKIITGKKF